MKKLVAVLLILVLCVSACTYAEETRLCAVCGRMNTENFSSGCVAENQGEDSMGRGAGDTVTFGTYAGEPIEWQIM